MALNLQSYGSGSHPWGNLKPDYLEKVFVSSTVFNSSIIELKSLMVFRFYFSSERFCGGTF